MSDTINIKSATDLGVTHAAFLDGSSHPVEAVYGSLTAAQVDYPFAVAGQEIDGCAVQKAKAVSTGQPIYIPPGLGFVNVRILIDDVNGLNLFGTPSTTLRWTGDAAHPVFWLRGTNGCKFGPFAIGGSPCSAAFRVTPHVGGPISSGSDEFDHLDVFLAATHGFDINHNDGANDAETTATDDSNNELHHWRRVRTNFTTVSAFHIFGTQAHALIFEDVQSLGGQYIVWCEYGAFIHWLRGSGGYTTVADFALDAFFAGPSSINCWNSEGSRRLLTCQAPSWNGDAGNVAIRDTRFSGIGTPDVNNEDDAILVQFPGPLIVENCIVEYLNACRPRIRCNNFSGNPLLTLTNNRFRSGLPGDWPYPALRIDSPGMNFAKVTDRNLYWQRSTSGWGYLSAEPVPQPLPLWD